MQPKTKIVVAVLAVALVAVIGLIALLEKNGAGENGTAVAVTEEMTLDAADADKAADETVLGQDEEQAQGGEDAAQDMYEGALAGMTEEEIAAMALAEEASEERKSDDGAEGAVD